jgi:hypothetical protein
LRAFSFAGVIRNTNSRLNGRQNLKDKHMKTLKKLLVITAVVAMGATLSAKAGEPLYSPKAKEQAAAFRKVPASRDEVNLATNRPNGSAKAWDVAQSLRTVPATGPEIDLAHAPRPALPAKDPGYDVAWRENAAGAIQIAPVK